MRACLEAVRPGDRVTLHSRGQTLPGREVQEVGSKMTHDGFWYVYWRLRGLGELHPLSGWSAWRVLSVERVGR